MLEVLESEQLQENAKAVGQLLLDGLTSLWKNHQLIGDVRGSGFFLGVELVRDRETLEPAGVEASFISNRMRELNVLIGCLLYTSPSPRDATLSRMPSSA